MQETCGAKTRNGHSCKNAPMQNGRCRMHGGMTPKGVDSPQYKTGRYSKYVSHDLQSSIQELENYPILDLADELQAQRALLSEYMKRYQTGGKMTEYSIGAVISWINSVGVMVERIMKIRNETALTGAEIAHLKLRTAELVTKYIDDPEKRRQFVIELFQVQQPALTE
jgi:hypothetical protein